jgi:hypothetical protein
MLMSLIVDWTASMLMVKHSSILFNKGWIPERGAFPAGSYIAC